MATRTGELESVLIEILPLCFSSNRVEGAQILARRYAVPGSFGPGFAFGFGLWTGRAHAHLDGLNVSGRGAARRRGRDELLEAAVSLLSGE